MVRSLLLRGHGVVVALIFLIGAWSAQGGNAFCQTPRIVPNVIGMPGKDAKALIEAAGLQPNIRLGQEGTADDAFRVYALDPPPGTKLGSQATVRMTIFAQSSAPAPSSPAAANASVPSVVGLSSQQAKILMEAAGLVPQFHVGVAPPAAAQAWTVYQQEPPAQAEAVAGAVVKLVIYDQADPAAPADPLGGFSILAPRPSMTTPAAAGKRRPPRKSISVPRGVVPEVVGEPIAKARAMIDAAALVPKLAPGGPAESVDQVFHVQALDPPPGTKLSEGAMVVVRLLTRPRADEPAANEVPAASGLPQQTIDTASAPGKGFAADLFQSHHGGLRVNLRTGNLTLQQRDFSSASPAGALGVERTYNSLPAEPVSSDASLFGPGWSSNVEVSLGWNDAAQPTIREADGFRLAFVPTGEESSIRGLLQYATEVRGPQMLVAAGAGTAARQDPRGIVDVFDESGLLLETRDLHGNGVLFRRKAGKVTALEGSGGRRVTIRYEDGRPSVFVGPDNLETEYRYDSRGRLVEVVRPGGRAKRFAYDDQDRLVALTAVDGSMTTISYEARGKRVAQVEEPLGRKTSYRYWSGDGVRRTFVSVAGATTTYTFSNGGQKVVVSDALGRSTQRLYDEFLARILEEQLPDGSRRTFTYDERGRPTSAADVSGATTLYNYPASGVMDVVDPAGGKTRVEYDDRGKPVRVRSPGGAVYRLQYDGRGNVIAVTDAADSTIRYEYDSMRQLAAAIDPWGRRSEFSWDPAGRLVERRDAAGSSTKLEYDEVGRLIRQVDPNGLVMQYAYDATDRLVSETDGAGNATRYTSDAFGRLTERVDPLGNRWRYAYDAAGNLTKTVDPTGAESSFEYDAAGRLMAKIDSAGRRVRFEYDQGDRLVALTLPGGLTRRLTYDAHGRLTADSGPHGARSDFRYDPLARVVESRDAAGNSWKYAYAANGKLASVTDPLGNITRYGYDPAARLAQVEDAAGRKVVYHRDKLGRISQLMDRAGQTTRFAYDAAGRLNSVTTADGQTSHLEYDPAGRLIGETHGDGTTRQYGYDAANRLAEITGPDGTQRRTCDAAGRVLTVEYVELKSKIAYLYDPLGRLTAVTMPDGSVTRYQYDAGGRVAELQTAEGAFAFARDEVGREKSVRYPNGVTLSRDYDTAGRIRKVTGRGPAGDVFLELGYQYDQLGRLTVAEEGGAPHTMYRYDAGSQLVAADVLGTGRYQYGYGPTGDRTTISEPKSSTKVAAQYDAAGRLLSAGSLRYVYDSQGQVIERHNGDSVTRLAYDSRGHLQQSTLPDGGKLAFGYDAMGRRYLRKDADGLRYFLHDPTGLDLWAELDSEHQTTARYVHAPGIDRPLAVTRDGQTHFLHADRMGSIRVVTDAGGKVVARYAYDPFGVPGEATGGVSQPFRYTGRPFDEALGLSDHRARWYDPAAGRFISQDAWPGNLYHPGSLQPYLYAANNPLSFRDPLGTHQWPHDADDVFDYVTGGGGKTAWIKPSDLDKLDPLMQANTRELVGRIASETDILGVQAQGGRLLVYTNGPNNVVVVYPEPLGGPIMSGSRGPVKPPLPPVSASRPPTSGFRPGAFRGLVGPVLTGLGAAASGYHVATAEDKGVAAIQEGVPWFGGLAGGFIGGPPGAFVGGLAGNALVNAPMILHGIVNDPPASPWTPPTDPNRSQPLSPLLLGPARDRDPAELDQPPTTPPPGTVNGPLVGPPPKVGPDGRLVPPTRQPTPPQQPMPQGPPIDVTQLPPLGNLPGAPPWIRNPLDPRFVQLLNNLLGLNRRPRTPRPPPQSGPRRRLFEKSLEEAAQLIEDARKAADAFERARTKFRDGEKKTRDDWSRLQKEDATLKDKEELLLPMSEARSELVKAIREFSKPTPEGEEKPDSSPWPALSDRACLASASVEQMVWIFENETENHPPEWFRDQKNKLKANIDGIAKDMEAAKKAPAANPEPVDPERKKKLEAALAKAKETAKAMEAAIREMEDLGNALDDFDKAVGQVILDGWEAKGAPLANLGRYRDLEQLVDAMLGPFKDPRADDLRRQATELAGSRIRPLIKEGQSLNLDQVEAWQGDAAKLNKRVWDFVINNEVNLEEAQEAIREAERLLGEPAEDGEPGEDDAPADKDRQEAERCLREAREKYEKLKVPQRSALYRRSAKPTMATVAVPNVVGQSAPGARQHLIEATLVPEFHVGQDALSPQQAHRVYHQEPAAGTIVPGRSRVRVTIFGQHSSHVAAATPAHPTPSAMPHSPRHGPVHVPATPGHHAPGRDAAEGEGFRPGDGGLVDGRLAPAAVTNGSLQYEGLPTVKLVKPGSGPRTAIELWSGHGVPVTQNSVVWFIKRYASAADAHSVVTKFTEHGKAEDNNLGALDSAVVKSRYQPNDALCYISVNERDELLQLVATVYQRAAVYRDRFVIGYHCSKGQFGADLHSAGNAVLAKSKELIDLRFPGQKPNPVGRFLPRDGARINARFAGAKLSDGSTCPFPDPTGMWQGPSAGPDSVLSHSKTIVHGQAQEYLTLRCCADSGMARQFMKKVYADTKDFETDNGSHYLRMVENSNTQKGHRAQVDTSRISGSKETYRTSTRSLITLYRNRFIISVALHVPRLTDELDAQVKQYTENAKRLIDERFPRE